MVRPKPVLPNPGSSGFILGKSYPFMAQEFRLVNYYNLPRNMSPWIWRCALNWNLRCFGPCCVFRSKTSRTLHGPFLFKKFQFSISRPHTCGAWNSQKRCFTWTGWCFGTCFFSIYIGNVIIPTDFQIFQRGRYTTNQFLLMKSH